MNRRNRDCVFPVEIVGFTTHLSQSFRQEGILIHACRVCWGFVKGCWSEGCGSAGEFGNVGDGVGEKNERMPVEGQTSSTVE